MKQDCSLSVQRKMVLKRVNAFAAGHSKFTTEIILNARLYDWIFHFDEYFQNLASKAKLRLLGLSADRGPHLTRGSAVIPGSASRSFTSPWRLGDGYLWRQETDWVWTVCDAMPSQWWALNVRLLEEFLRSKLFFIRELSEQSVVTDKVIFRMFLKRRIRFLVDVFCLWWADTGKTLRWRGHRRRVLIKIPNLLLTIWSDEMWGLKGTFLCFSFYIIFILLWNVSLLKLGLVRC